MTLIEVNIDALKDVTTALMGDERSKIVFELYNVVDRAERRGHAAGFDIGVQYGTDEGVQDGFASGFEAGEREGYLSAEADAETNFNEAYDAGYAEGAATRCNGCEDSYGDGYEQARRDLGECPTVDPEFDENGYDNLWTGNVDGYMVR